jgi:hypothetical protein
MNKETDLLPGILGTLLAASAAAAIIAGSTHTSASLVTTASQAMRAMPEPVPAAVSVPAPMRAVSAGPSSPAAAAVIRPNKQIWQCVTNGQKTFSNNPCGENPSVLNLGAVNGMDPTPLLPLGRSYAADFGAAPDYSDSAPVESSAYGYPVIARPQYVRHERAASVQAPTNHWRAPSARRN